jgi:hypothetical protein
MVPCGNLFKQLINMTEAPFTNRELRKYFEDFRIDLKNIKEEIQVSRRSDNERFLAIEEDVMELKIKHENIGIKVAGMVFVATTVVAIIINRVLT